MAIAGVDTLGPTQDTNNTATVAFTFGSGESVAQGDAVVLYVGSAGSASAVAISASDTKGNTYQVDATIAPSGSVAASILSGQITTELVEADVITVTLGHACTDKQIVVRSITNQAVSGIRDIIATAGLGGTGSTQPSVSSSPTQTTQDGDYLGSLTVWNGSAAMTAVTVVSDGDNIVSKVAAAPTNGVITIEAAEYRTTDQIVPKAGQKLLGEGAATTIINCSKLLTGWTGSGPYVWSGTVPGPTLLSSGSVPTNLVYPQSKYVDVLYRNKAPVWTKGVRVGGTVLGSAATPAAGECFIDYDADTITYGSNPSGATMEMSQPFYGINGNLADVTVAGVTVFGSSLRGIRCGGDRWEVKRNTVIGNYIGISAIGNNCNIHHNLANYNVQLGINANGAAPTIADNEIAHNDTNKLYTTNGNSANGGLKITGSDGAMVLRNLVHHNEGPGIWFDINCINATITGNESHDNVQGSGVHYEISYAATINDNLLYDNGDRGLWISTSQNVAASGNKCWGNTTQNVLITDNAARTDTHPFGALRGINNTLTSNEFWADSSPSVQGTQAGTSDNQVFTTNHWVTNTHHQTSSSMTPYSWPSATNQAGWIAKGNDIAGTYTNDLASPTYPTPALSAPSQTDESNPETSIYAGHFDNGGASQTKQMSVREDILGAAPSLIQRSDTLAATQPWACALVTYKEAGTTPPPPSVKTVPRGLALRDSPAPSGGWGGAYGNSFSHAQRRIYWDQIQPTDTNVLNPSGGSDSIADITADLDLAEAHGKTMGFRIFCGYRSPAWLTSKVGSFRYRDPVKDNTGAYVNPIVSVPKFWTAQYLADYDRFIKLLGAAFDDHPALSMIQLANAMTYFAEELIKHVSAKENRAEMVGGGLGWDGTPRSAPAAGYSDANNMAAIKAGIDIHSTYFPNTPASISYNPYSKLLSQTEAGITYWTPTNGQPIDNQTYQGGDDSNLTKTKEIINYHISKLGASHRVVLENNSVKQSFFNADKSLKAGKIQTMYGIFIDKGYPLYFQCGNASEIGDFPFVMSCVVETLLGNACEPTHNNGVTPYTAPELAAWNALLLGNDLPTAVTGHVPLNTSPPVIQTPTAGYTPTTVLTADLGSWDAGTNAITEWNIRWYKINQSTNARTSVRGPTAKVSALATDNYTIQAGDLGFKLVAVASATNSDGTSATQDSVFTPVVVTPASTAPVIVVAPTLDNTSPAVNETVNASHGTWTGTPTVYSYQWERSSDLSNWSVVQVGASASYVTTSSGASQYLRVGVVANNGQNSDIAYSNPTAQIASAPVISVTSPPTSVTLVTEATYLVRGSVTPQVGTTIVSLTLNGASVTLQTDNSFSTTVSVVTGSNTYTLIATDSNGHSASVSFSLIRDVLNISSDIADVAVRFHQRSLQ